MPKFIIKIINKLVVYGIYLFVFLLPWQTRWIYHKAYINNSPWEYGRFSLYASEIILLFVLFLAMIIWSYKFPHLNKEQKIKIIKNCFKDIPLLVVLLIGWSGLVIFWSADKPLAGYGWLKIIEGAGLYWFGSTLLFNINFKKISLAIISAGLIQSIIALGQWLYQSSISSKWLGLSYLNPSILGTAVIENNTGRFLRAYGTLPHPNILAGFLVICILLCLILLINDSVKKYHNFSFFVMPFLTTALFFTFSRSGWMALLACLALLWLIYLKEKKSLKKLLLSTLLIIFIFSFLTLNYADLIKTRTFSQGRLEIKSNQERLNYFHQSWDVIKINWFKGIGLNNYTYYLSKKNPNQNAWDYQPVHNFWLLVFAELGIIGLFLYLAIIIKSFINFGAFWPLLTAFAIISFFDHFFYSLYFGIVLWWLIICFNKKGLSQQNLK